MRYYAAALCALVLFVAGFAAGMGFGDMQEMRTREEAAKALIVTCNVQLAECLRYSGSVLDRLDRLDRFLKEL